MWDNLVLRSRDGKYPGKNMVRTGNLQFTPTQLHQSNAPTDIVAFLCRTLIQSIPHFPSSALCGAGTILRAKAMPSACRSNKSKPSRTTCTESIRSEDRNIFRPRSDIL